jgi:serine/threonine protein kinase
MAIALPSVVMVLPWYKNGDLFRHVLERGALDSMTTSEKILVMGKWAMQIAGALHAIHSKGWIHRDIKPENIFLSDSEDAILADFGYAIKSSDTEAVVQAEGTILYMAPEVARLHKSFSKKSQDYWKRTHPESINMLVEILERKDPVTGAADVFSLAIMIASLTVKRQLYSCAGLDCLPLVGCRLYVDKYVDVLLSEFPSWYRSVLLHMLMFDPT